MTLQLTHVLGAFHCISENVLRCIYTSENFPRNGKFSADRMRSTIFSVEKIVLRMRSVENFPFCEKFPEVYMHLYLQGRSRS